MMTIHNRNHFLSDKAYENYLKDVRKRKNYLFYNEFIIRLMDNGMDVEKALQIAMMVHRERDITRGYHYKWYSRDALECIHLIEREMTGKVK